MFLRAAWGARAPGEFRVRTDRGVGTAQVARAYAGAAPAFGIAELDGGGAVLDGSCDDACHAARCDEEPERCVQFRDGCETCEVLASAWMPPGVTEAVEKRLEALARRPDLAGCDASTDRDRCSLPLAVARARELATTPPASGCERWPHCGAECVDARCGWSPDKGSEHVAEQCFWVSLDGAGYPSRPGSLECRTEPTPANGPAAATRIVP